MFNSPCSIPRFLPLQPSFCLPSVHSRLPPFEDLLKAHQSSQSFCESSSTYLTLVGHLALPILIHFETIKSSGPRPSALLLPDYLHYLPWYSFYSISHQQTICLILPNIIVSSINVTYVKHTNLNILCGCRLVRWKSTTVGFWILVTIG